MVCGRNPLLRQISLSEGIAQQVLAAYADLWRCACGQAGDNMRQHEGDTPTDKHQGASQGTASAAYHMLTV